MIGKIIKIISNQYTIVDENDNIYQCIAMGKVRLQMTPFVGDKVEVVKFDDKYGIEKIYPRDNFMIRPAVANIDQLIIVPLMETNRRFIQNIKNSGELTANLRCQTDTLAFTARKSGSFPGKSQIIKSDIN